MKRKWSKYILLIMFVGFLTACNSTADAVVDYNNDFILTDYVENENEYIATLNEYETVLEENDFDITIREEIMIENVLPKAKQLFDKVRGATFENEEIQEVHQLLVESEDFRYQATEKELEAIKGNSEQLFNESVSLMEQSDEQKNAFYDKMKDLTEKHNLEAQDE